MNRIIYGKGIVPGDVEGYVLVSRTLLSLLDGLDPETGTIVQKGHELEGMVIARKILVVYGEKGSTAGVWKFIEACYKKKSPKGVIVSFDPEMSDSGVGGVVSGAIERRIPLISAYKKDLDDIKTGDYIKMTAEERKIEKTNDHFVAKPGKGVIEIIR